jgi:hypothetical protein
LDGAATSANYGSLAAASSTRGLPGVIAGWLPVEFVHAPGASVFPKLALQFEALSAETSLPTGCTIAARRRRRR